MNYEFMPPAQKELILSVRNWDKVSFGQDWELYIINAEWIDDRFFITEDKEQRFNSNALGSYIMKELAIKIIESREEVQDWDIYEEVSNL